MHAFTATLANFHAAVFIYFISVVAPAYHCLQYQSINQFIEKHKQHNSKLLRC